MDGAWSLRLHPPFTNNANFKAFNVFDFYHEIYVNIEKSIQIINCMFVRMGQIQIYDSRTYVSWWNIYWLPPATSSSVNCMQIHGTRLWYQRRDIEKCVGTSFLSLSPLLNLCISEFFLFFFPPLFLIGSLIFFFILLLFFPSLAYIGINDMIWVQFFYTEGILNLTVFSLFEILLPKSASFPF